MGQKARKQDVYFENNIYIYMNIKTFQHFNKWTLILKETKQFSVEVKSAGH